MDLPYRGNPNIIAIKFRYVVEEVEYSIEKTL